MNAKEFNEVELVKHLESFANTLGLTIIGREIRLGAFRFDAIAYDENGTVVVVELKVVATKDALAQLLIYPHAIRKFMVRNGIAEPKVRSLLISTHLDANVAEISVKVSELENLTLKICIGSLEDGLQLVDPQEAGDQVWDQSLRRQICDLQIVNGQLALK